MISFNPRRGYMTIWVVKYIPHQVELLHTTNFGCHQGVVASVKEDVYWFSKTTMG